MKTKTFFKIRDKKTGLFSRGGVGPSWSVEGKTWSSIGAVKNHLLQFTGSQRLSNRIEWNMGVHTYCQSDVANVTLQGKDGIIYHIVIPESWEIVEVIVTPIVMNSRSALDVIKQTLMSRE